MKFAMDLRLAAGDTATLIDRVDALRLVTDLIPVGTWKIHVKALDSVGLYSVPPPRRPSR